MDRSRFKINETSERIFIALTKDLPDIGIQPVWQFPFVCFNKGKNDSNSKPTDIDPSNKDVDTAESDEKVFMYKSVLYVSEIDKKTVKASDIDITHLENGLNKHDWDKEASEEWQGLGCGDAMEKKKLQVGSGPGSKKCAKEPQSSKTGPDECADEADIEAFDNVNQEISDEQLERVRQFFVLQGGLNKPPPIEVLKMMRKRAKSSLWSPFDTGAWIAWRETAQCLTRAEAGSKSKEQEKPVIAKKVKALAPRRYIPAPHERKRHNRLPRPSWMSDVTDEEKAEARNLRLCIQRAHDELRATGDQ